MKFFHLNVMFVLVLLLGGCGEPGVDINRHAIDTYESKIVIAALIYPDAPVRNVRITRNFPIGTNLRNRNMIISDARVVLRDEQEARDFPLQFNEQRGSYEYAGGDLQIGYGKTYTLEVTAILDGQERVARSTTTTPEAGFHILPGKSVLGAMPYRQRDSGGELKNFSLTFERSPGTDFYVLFLTAVDADTSTFIYDNPFGDFNTGDVLDDFDDFRYNFTWIQDTPLAAGESTIDVFWFLTWFYGDYRAIVYAADKNYKDFLVTHDQVQEIDGNFHEPAFHIEGNGIGYFGSAIVDSVHFQVLRNENQ